MINSVAIVLPYLDPNLLCKYIFLCPNAISLKTDITNTLYGLLCANNIANKYGELENRGKVRIGNAFSNSVAESGLHECVMVQISYALLWTLD